MICFSGHDCKGNEHFGDSAILQSRVRFCGHQPSERNIYVQIDNVQYFEEGIRGKQG